MTVELIEQLRAVAEYMGCYKETVYCGVDNTSRETWGFKDTHITERWHDGCWEDNCPYHTDYNLLMPVAKKVCEEIPNISPTLSFFDGSELNLLAFNVKMATTTFNISDLLTAIYNAIKFIQNIKQQS